jgi:hypothetical protein
MAIMAGQPQPLAQTSMFHGNFPAVPQKRPKNLRFHWTILEVHESYLNTIFTIPEKASDFPSSSDFHWLQKPKNRQGTVEFISAGSMDGAVLCSVDV